MKYKKSDDPMNPNGVKPKEVDEVFISQATEIAFRKKKAKTPLHLHQSQRDNNIKKAEEIVARAKKKGK